MRNTLLLIVALFLTMGATAQKTTIKGSIEGVGEGCRMVVFQAVGNQMMPLDTVTIGAKGEYSVRLDPEQPTLYIMTLMTGKQPTLHMMMERGDKVTLNGQYIESYNHINVTKGEGSENAVVFHQFNNMLMQSNSAEKIAKLLGEHNRCLMSAFLVTYFDRDFLGYVELYKNIRDGLIEKYPNDAFVQTLDRRVKSAIVPGSEAPDIAMTDPQGQTRKLSDLRGNIVLLDFWASWCRPCRGENPNVVRLYNKYHDKGFEIYSVSMDKNRNDWVTAIAADGLVWPNHVSDLKGWTSTGGSIYGISSIPATVLIDREGKVMARNLRGEELEMKLKEIFE